LSGKREKKRMIHLRNVKLKYQLVLLISIGIFMMIVVQLFYYFRFYYLVQDKAELYAVNTIKQANDKLNLTTVNIKKAANTAAYNTTVQDYLNRQDLPSKNELQAHALNVLKSIINSNACIADIALVDEEENIFTAYSQFSYLFYDAIKSRYNLRDIDEAFYTPLIEADDRFYCYVMPIFNAAYQSGDKKKLGECIVLCPKKYLQNIVENTSITPNSLFLLMDGNHQVVVANRSGFSKDAAPFLEKEFFISNSIDKQERISYNGNLSMIKVKSNEDMGWKTISITPVNELTSDLQPIKLLGIVIGVVTVALLLLAGFIVSRSITRPVAHIVKKMGEIGEKNLKQRIKLKETNEIGIIAKDINQMLDKIENITESVFRMQTKLYETELSKKEAEFSALQSQINPHFLYNTLECIRSIGLVHKVMEIVSISTAMANIFRYSIKGDSFSTISEELEAIRDYVGIIAIRYEGKFSTIIDVEQSLLERKMIKMILQPIVENAVYHGLEPKDDTGTLYLKGSISDDKMVFEISDDGIGMNEAEVDRINSSFIMKEELKGMVITNKRSIGLTNINNRIKLYYGDDYGIHLYSREEEGTRVVVELPLAESDTEVTLKIV
jgi:two-component system, sensor histidine kinase YesM